MIDIARTTDEQLDTMLDEILDSEWEDTPKGEKEKEAYKVQLKSDILDLIKQEVFLSRVDEATRACRQWEKKPGSPATYLIERIDDLRDGIKELNPGVTSGVAHPPKP